MKPSLSSLKSVVLIAQGCPGDQRPRSVAKLKNPLNLLAKLVLMLGIALSSGVLTSEANAQGVSLPPGYVVIVDKAKCGLIKGRWTAGTLLRNGNFYTFAAQVKAQQKKLKKATGTKARLIEKKIASLKLKLQRQSKSCKKLSGSATPTPTATPTTAPTAVPTAVPTPETPLPGSQTIAWNQDVQDLGGTSGQEILYFCPSNGTVTAIYGHDIYTADSSICSAAVHAGLITAFRGGNVKVLVKPGQSSYTGSVRNDVTSSFWLSYTLSYSFVSLTTGQEIITTDTPTISDSLSGTFFVGLPPQTFTFYCAANTSLRSLWGTGIYTSDSPICTAAVHAGIINRLTGGIVKFAIQSGQSSYTGSTANGVTSSSYGSYSSSFAFVP